MKIRIIRKPRGTYIDGIRLDTFEVGRTYTVGDTFGALMVAERWAEPVDDLALGTPLRELQPDDASPPAVNLSRAYPSHYDGFRAVASHRRSRY